jgi:hypothetical protein
VAGAVSWVGLVTLVNLAINSVTLLLVIAQQLRLSSALAAAAARDRESRYTYRGE